MKELKVATKMIINLPCRNRLLCRIITYSTWILLKTGKLGDMKSILREAEDYMTLLTEKDVCPNSSMGYYFFDYARFYIKKGKNNRALEKANASLAQFRMGKKHSVGMILVLAMVARLYLNCGEDFERRNIQIISSLVYEAKELLDEARKLSSKTAVEEATIRLTEIDLFYRLGKTQLAIDTARKCVDVATVNSLDEERLRAKIRMKSLKSMNMTGTWE